MSRSAAFELFGEMRHSTPEEQQLFKEIVNKYSVPIEGINIFNMDQEPYYIRYIASIGFVDVPAWLQLAVDNKLININHPNEIQDIWDLSWSYEGVPTLTVIKTGKEFRMGGPPITYEDVYGDINETKLYN